MEMYSKKRKRVIYGLAVFLSVLVGAVVAYTAAIPDEITLFEDEIKVVDLSYPFYLSGGDTVTVMASESENGIFTTSLNISADLISKSEVAEAGKSFSNDSEGTSYAVAADENKGKLYFTLFDKITLKEITVSVRERKELIAGGQSIGVKMNVKGVIVVGMEEIPISSEETVNPCMNSGLQIGDNIIEINGEEILNAVQVQKIVNSSEPGKEVSIIAKRNGESINAGVIPVYSFDEKIYRLGLWVRDKTAGIGTLTFYDMADGNYGALGHGIGDPDTGVLLDAANGEALHSRVVSVKQGASGSPGEIKGIFYETNHPLGSIISNTQFGVFGKAYKEMVNAVDGKIFEIGCQNEVKKGPATILTTLDENGVKEYSIEIEKITRQLTPSTKSMVIKVTDKELLKKSGGIVQGMSGSPIIQNGKIIGAVTHVFVNNPQKGYGVFIEWMLKEAEKTDNVIKSA